MAIRRELPYDPNKRYSARGQAISAAHLRGKAAELAVYRRLLHLGFRDVKRFRPNAPLDLEVDGHPVEIKSSIARPSTTHGLCWTFTIRKWRRPLPRHVIAYIFCLADVPGGPGLTYVVVPGALEVPAYKITLAELKGKHRRNIDNWNALQPVRYPLKPREQIEHLVMPAKGFPASARKNEYDDLNARLHGTTWQDREEQKRITKEWLTRNSASS
jgi:hypothetical protein